MTARRRSRRTAEALPYIYGRRAASEASLAGLAAGSSLPRGLGARGRRCLMDQREEWNRAKWASRRGLLELDLLLSPFVAEAFSDLSDDLRADYRELLFQDDQDLLEWIMGRADITDVRFLDIVDSIRRFHRIPL